eukprot:TRINITY_DN9124_c0_g1_i1.p1 TRINITY_DN9124_c0_g1~~TRINITY_DN9124_c0_g1_i1.p1  ORF type:complete len:1558 (-),score=457.62 TRINITY_DN9124_c0_g1_i1:167-4840(-)
MSSLSEMMSAIHSNGAPHPAGSPPVSSGSLPALLTAARQQTELVFWVARSLEDHEQRLQKLSEDLKAVSKKPWSQEADEQGDGSPAWDEEDALDKNDNIITRLTTWHRETKEGHSPSKWIAQLEQISKMKSGGEYGEMEEATEEGRTELEQEGSVEDSPAGVFDSEAEAAGASAVASVQNNLRKTIDATLHTFEEMSKDVDARLAKKMDFLQQKIEEALEQMEKEVRQSIAQDLHAAASGAASAAIEERLGHPSGPVSNGSHLSAPAGLQDSGQSASALLAALEEPAQLLRTSSPAQGSESGGAASDPKKLHPEGEPVSLGAGRTAMGAAKLLHQKRSLAEKTAGKAGQPASQGVAELMTVVRALVDDVNKRLAPVEQSLASVRQDVEAFQTEVKPWRLEIPRISEDLKELTSSATDVMSRLLTADEQLKMLGAEGLDQVKSQAASARSRPATKLEPTVASVMSSGASKKKDESIAADMGKVIGKVDEESKAAVADLQKKYQALSDKLTGFDIQLLEHARKLDGKMESLRKAHDALVEEDFKLGKAWNLTQQVDVVQSLVKEETRHLKSDLEGLLKAQLKDEKAVGLSSGASRLSSKEDRLSPEIGQPPAFGSSDLSRSISVGGKGGGKGLNKRPEMATLESVEKIDEKVRRMQDVMQIQQVKIAALRTTTKHLETLSQTAVETAKKVSYDTELVLEAAALRLRQGFFGGGEETPLSPLSPMSPILSPFSPQASGVRRNRGNSISSSTAWRRSSTQSNNVLEIVRKQLGGLPASPGAKALEPPEAAAARSQSTELADAAEESRASSKASDAPKGGRRKSAKPQLTVTAVESPADVVTETVNAHADREMSYAKLARLGKKIVDLDGQVDGRLAGLKKEMWSLEKRLLLLSSFLPKRLSRILDSALASMEQDEAEAEEQKPPAPGDEAAVKEGDDAGKKKVSFNVKKEVRKFEIDEDASPVPWQKVGEPAVKWAWCLQPMNDVGRDLARQFELMEDEKEELEARLESQLEALRGEIEASKDTFHKSQPMVAARASLAVLGEDGADAGLAGKTSAASLKAVLPLLVGIEDRVDRLARDINDCRRHVDVELAGKADKRELQQAASKLSKLDHFDPVYFGTKLENVAQTSNHAAAIAEEGRDRALRVEQSVASAELVMQNRTEIQNNRKMVVKYGDEIKALQKDMYKANQASRSMVEEMNNTLTLALGKLEREKVSADEYTQLVDRLAKLEHGMRDNRDLMDDAMGGAELNQIVKRIILNLEDKLMLLQRKVDTFEEAFGRPMSSQGAVPFRRDPPAAQAAPRASSDQHGSGPSSMQDKIDRDIAALHGVTTDMTSVSAEVHQLKQEVKVTRLNMEHIAEQGYQQIELAQQLHVAVVDAAGVAEDVGTALSLNRVQVMLGAAARQLVAGAKWVTQDVFDVKVAEVRKEYLTAIRQLEQCLEEVGAYLAASQNAAVAPMPSPQQAAAAVRLPGMTKMVGPGGRLLAAAKQLPHTSHSVYSECSDAGGGGLDPTTPLAAHAAAAGAIAGSGRAVVQHSSRRSPLGMVGTPRRLNDRPGSRLGNT